MQKSRVDCEFCSIPDLKTTEYFKSIHGSLPHTLKIQGLPGGFTVLQDLVPIAEKGGHLLLMPNEHFISLATIDNQIGLATATVTIILKLRINFPRNPILFFEHGPGFIKKEPIACGGCHLDHAHGHIMILPEWAEFNCIQKCVETALMTNGWDKPNPCGLGRSNIFTDIVQATGVYPYLYIAMKMPDETESSCVYIQKEEHCFVPSQLLRKVVSEVIYNQSASTFWHWKDIQIGLSTTERIEQVKKDAILFREITGF